MNYEDLVNQISKLTPNEYINLDTGRKNNKNTIGRKKIKFVSSEYKVVSDNEHLFKEVITELRSRNTPKETHHNIMSYLIHKFKKLVISDSNDNNRSSNNSSSSPLRSPNSKSFNSSISGFVMVPSQTSVLSYAPLQPEGDDAIPEDVRYQVWQRYLGNVLDGKCFVCDIFLSYRSWHCGHIIARKNGGSIEVENLRPICGRCNHKMGIMHMYLYILLNDLPSKTKLNSHLKKDKSITETYEHISKALVKVEELKQEKIITKTQAKNYIKAITSTRCSPNQRRGNIERFYKKYYPEY